MFQALATAEGRRSFWADSADGSGDHIEFRFSNGAVLRSRVIASEPGREFRLTYFEGSTVTFRLEADRGGGTKLVLVEEDVPEPGWTENLAGWVSVLLNLKGRHMVAQGAKKPGPDRREELLATLRSRFEKNMHRHPGIEWEAVRSRLENHSDKLWSLGEMERTGGEPDVMGQAEESGAYVFVDCSAESPEGRRSVCYDGEALASRKKHRPAASAVDLATGMGAALLTEAEYRRLQELGEFDTRTSSWLETPPAIRELGGAVFGDRRFGTVWVYHNGAESYYAARGFRCALRV